MDWPAHGKQADAHTNKAIVAVVVFMLQLFFFGTRSRTTQATYQGGRPGVKDALSAPEAAQPWEIHPKYSYPSAPVESVSDIFYSREC